MAKSVKCLAYFLLTFHLLYKCKSEVVFDCTDSDESLDSDESDEKEAYCAQLRSSEENNEQSESADQTSNTDGAIYSCSNQEQNFTCTSEGRFPDLSDSTCMKYFQCDERSNGEFNQKNFKCPNSQFSPSTQKCSYKFVCPCSSSSGGSSTSSIGTTESSTPSTSTIRGCSLSTKKFVCSVKGRFADLSDASCRRYFLCSELHNGTFVKTLYRCMQSSFNPLTHRCSTSYACPCSASKTTSKAAETSLTTSPVVTSSIASVIITQISAAAPASTPYTCTPTSNDEFTCTDKGRFPDFSDPLCEKYFLCSYLQNGSFVKTNYKCLNSVFDPTTNRCSTKIVCPCSVSTSTEPDVTTTSDKITTAFEAAASTPGTTTSGGGFITTANSSVSVTAGTTTTQAITKTPVESTTSEQTTMTSHVTTTSASTASSYTCSSTTYDSGEFECTTVGRFPDFGDSTCEKYFLCSYLQNGTFIKTNYRCLKSVFDPETKRCSTKVVCPCSLTSSTPEVSTRTSVPSSSEKLPGTTTSAPTMSSVRDTTTSLGTTTTSEMLTTKHEETTNTMAPNVTTTLAITTTSSYTCSSATNDNGEFECTNVGRFPDFSDSTCEKYFLCSYLQNGTFIKTQYRCLKSVFDPETKRCSTKVVCPCSLTSPTPEVSTRTSIPSSSEELPGTTTSAPTMSSARDTTTSLGTTTTSEMLTTKHEETTTTLIPNISTTSAITTTSSYTCSPASNDYGEFECTTVGRFPDFSDSTCEKYFLCSILQNGTFIKTQYRCLKSVFDPETKRCSTKVVCPCSLTSSTPEVSTRTSIPSSSEELPGTTTSAPTMSSARDTTTSLGTTTTSEMLTTKHEETTTTLIPNISTTSAITTTSSYTCSPASNDYGEFECTTVGRFPDFSDSTCEKYFLCSYLQNGTFIKTQYRCLKSVFDPETKRCSTKVVCPCSLTSSTPEVSTRTSVSSSSEKLPGTTTSAPTMSSVRDTTTSLGTTTTSEMLTTKHEETTNTMAPNVTTTSAITTTSSYTCSPASNDYGEFECTTVGRFPDFSDSTCEKYFLCSYLQNGTFIKTEYRCLKSVFDPETKRCSTKAVCPCSLTSSTPEVSTRTSIPSSSEELPGTTTSAPTMSSARDTTTSLGTTTTSEMLTTKHEETTTTLIPNISTTLAITTTSSYTCSPASNDYGEFECTTVGRFPDFSDSNCEKYFLCSYLQNGTFIKTQYRCLKSVFDPETKRCSTKVVCPCSVTSSTPEVSTRTSIPSSSEELPGTTTSAPTMSSARDTTTSLGTTTTSERFTTKHTETTISSILTATTASERFTTAVPSVTTPLYTCSSSNNQYGKFYCTVTGRFADFADPLCQKYFLCSHLQNGTFIKTKYQCLSSIFNPTTKRCSKMYVCPCNGSVSTVTSTPSSTISSIETSAYETTATKLPSVTSGTSFSTEPTDVSSSTSFGCIVPFREFVCTQEGRFSDPSDVTCRRYFLCSHLRNDSFIKTSYICLNSFFSPLTFRCSLNYKCPCREDPSNILTTPQASVSTLSEGFTIISATPSERYTTLSALTTTVKATTSYTCESASEDAPQFICSSTGRFPDYGDNTCRRYFLCSLLQNGTFIKTPYSCPPSSCINQSIHRCSEECKCPCS